jgi:TM2 domain-containing membrane protein YozV
MTDTNTTSTANTTTIVIAKPQRSAIAAFFLTFIFGPLGLLYASIGGGIFLTICAVIFVPLTAGLAAFVLWPISMVWVVIAAIASKSQKQQSPKTTY